MHILVIGASRGIGLETVKLGLERGHAIRAFARSADGIALDHERLEKRPGDATRPDDVAAALGGVDAVVMALGVPKGLGFVFRPVTLFSDATRVVVPAMEAAAVRRLVAVTGFGAGDSYAALSAPERLGFRAVMKRAYDDKTRQEQIIMASTLDWTIARPVVLTNNRGSGRYRVLATREDWRNGLIPRADVAHFALTAIEDGSHIHQAPVLAR